MSQLEKAQNPTMYFIGVTTTKSSIMKVFPLWAKRLGLKNAELKGVDIPIHAFVDEYRKVVDFIKNDNLSVGALVTTHKLDIYEAAEDMFDYMDSYALKFREISSISKNEGRLEGHAKDFLSCALAMEAFIPKDYWRNNCGEVFIMGAGGSSLAICTYLMNEKHRDNTPSKIIISNRSQKRLDEAKIKISSLKSSIPVEYILSETSDINDDILSRLKPFSLVVNATGLGKDRPGSPLSDNCIFPQEGIVWELNYRGDLLFLKQANEQKEKKNLIIEDGWIYFIHGWTQVVSQVFHVDITGEVLSDCEKLAYTINTNSKGDHGKIKHP